MAIIKAKTISDEVGALLDLITEPKLDRLSVQCSGGVVGCPPLHKFSNLEPIALIPGLHPEDWGVFPPGAIDSPDIIWPLSVGVITNNGPDEGLVIHAWDTVSMKDCRGVATRVSPYMVRHRIALIRDTNTVTAATLFSCINGKWVSAVGDGVIEGPITTTNGPQSVPFGQSVALRQRYEWAVCIRRAGAPSIRISTDPTGVKELFRARDAAPGTTRKDSLLAWVTNHWRQNRQDPDMESFVRKHMRGATTFTWAGFECTVLPAAFDVEQLARLREERAKMVELKQTPRMRGIGG